MSMGDEDLPVTRREMELRDKALHRLLNDRRASDQEAIKLVREAASQAKIVATIISMFSLAIGLVGQIVIRLLIKSS